MDNHFDEMAKLLAGGITRRGALRGIVGGMAGALFASMGLAKAYGQAAVPKNCADYCKNFVGISPGKGNAYGKCVSNCAKCTDGGGVACGASACCGGGATSSCCSGACVDLTGNGNCGACGNECGSGTSCQAGVCVPDSPPET